MSRLDEADRSHRNIDLIFLGNGHLYIGEAKSNNEVDSRQFSFYEDICQHVAIDGIVFATSREAWSPGTMACIRQLRSRFGGDIRILTSHDLYSRDRFGY